MTGTAVDVRGLTAQYGAVRALDGLDLRVRSGRVTAVLGRNGAGKSTLIETIGGVRRVQAGAVEVLGRPVTDRSALTTEVGVMLQAGGVPTTAKGIAFLTHLARLYPDPAPVPDLVAALDLVTRPVAFRRLSGGQQQRLRLACALIGQPSLALLDEPASGLDPDVRARVWALIRSIADSGRTILVSTHSFEEAEAIADDVVILVGGRVHTAGPLSDLRGEPVVRFSTSSSVDLDALDSFLPGFVTRRIAEHDYQVEGPVSPDTVAAVGSFARDNAIALDQLALVRTSVRELFERSSQTEEGSA
jgi:ABC-2 type transport system ATP-binding protein